MAATSVWVLPPTKVSSMRWALRRGELIAARTSYWRLNVAMRRPVASTDYPALEKIADMAIKEKQKFERLVVPKETLLEMFNVRGVHPLYRPSTLNDALPVNSTTNTRSTSSRPKSPMEPLRLSTVVDLWSIFALAHISHTPARSRRSWSPRFGPVAHRCVR